jgi:hypothetical protein
VTDLNAWLIEHVADDELRRLAQLHAADALACELGVDIVADPHSEDDDGYVWTRLSRAKRVEDVTPGAAVVTGSRLGRYLARVVAWDLEVGADDPIVKLELVALSPEAVARALARNDAI